MGSSDRSESGILAGFFAGALVGAGRTPSCEYGYFDEYLSIRTTCSGTHKVEKPSRSALEASVLSNSPPAILPVPTANNPIFISFTSVIRFAWQILIMAALQESN